ncbi:MAG: hypothetical protein K2X98_06310 [Alphaproteobacteria bacterium]|nr:hypothetical protein [Alphaproteobacteria bacterium]
MLTFRLKVGAAMNDAHDNSANSVMRFHNIESSIGRIEQIDSLAKFHRFPDDFVEAWMKKISLLPPHCPMSDALLDLIGFELSIKDLFDTRTPIVLLGNYGAGKTLVAHKLLSLLNHFISEKGGEAATLHTISKDSIFDPKKLNKGNHNHYIIIDTPGWNPYAQENIPPWMEILLKAEKKLQFLWIQSAGFDCCESIMLSEKLAIIPLRGIIMTKVDVSMYNGLCLTLPYYTGAPLTFYNDSENPRTPLFPFFPRTVMDVLSV